jgi:hypothetical protein
MPTFGLIGSPTLIGRLGVGENKHADAAVELTTKAPAYGAAGALHLFESRSAACP